MKKWMQAWPEPDVIRDKARAELLWARKRRNTLIAKREEERSTTRPKLRNMTLTAREDAPQRFARVSARFYRMAEQESRREF